MESNTTKTLIIAEAGVNHNGSLDLAIQLVDTAASAGADIVKFQTFRASALVTPSAPKAPYQIETTGESDPQLEMLRGLELSAEDHVSILSHCRHRGIEFMSTPFDLESLTFLDQTLDVARIKIGSGDVTNVLLAQAAGRIGKPIILSTGMATLEEIGLALGALAYGNLASASPPSRAELETLRHSDAAAEYLKSHVTLLHCTTAYPTPAAEVNLLAISSLREAFGLPVGYSDHTVGSVVPVGAVALGANVIEKHITLDRSLPGPDHRASIEPDELATLVANIRIVERALGSRKKMPSPSELQNVAAARKSLVATAPIQAGEMFTTENLGIKRPGLGRSPFDYGDCLGVAASRNYEIDELIE